jgi:hypothetical protein
MEDDVSGASPCRHFLGSLVPLTVFSLVAGLLSAGPAVAHNFTKPDGNDSRGRLDLRSVSVSHTATGVVHRFQTYESWTARSLGADSFFIVQIDKNNNQRYERCAFIYFASRLRGSLTNCGATFIRSLPVTKLSPTAAKVTIPRSQTGSVYWWAGASLWDGPAPCGNGCIDFAPNNFPDILHDMLPPSITLDPDPLNIWESSTVPTFDFPFSVMDPHSHVKSWKVQSKPVGGTLWTTVASGLGGGSKNPQITSEAGRFVYRVVALDKQGNRAISSRPVLVPKDDTSIAPGDFAGGTPLTVSNSDAFGGSFQELDAGESVTFTLASFSECEFELAGPGSGTWQVDVTLNGAPLMHLDATNFDDLQRQTLFDMVGCLDPSTLVFTVTSGSGFGVDAFVPAA